MPEMVPGTAIAQGDLVAFNGSVGKVTSVTIHGDARVFRYRGRGTTGLFTMRPDDRAVMLEQKRTTGRAVTTGRWAAVR